MSDYFFRFSKCSLWSLKILCLTFNYQLISWCFGVCQIFLAICPVNLRYSGPKSAEKWPFPQQNKIQKKFCENPQIFQGCSQWSQVITLGGPNRFLWKNQGKKSFFKKCGNNHGTPQVLWLPCILEFRRLSLNMHTSI